MVSPTTFPIPSGSITALECVANILKSFPDGDYYAYERDDVWHLGIGTDASLYLDHAGKTVTVNEKGKQTETKIESHEEYNSIVQDFTSPYVNNGVKVFGQIGFNYAAFSRGLDFKQGTWPLVSVMVPRLQLEVESSSVKLWNWTGEDVSPVETAIASAPLKPSGHPGMTDLCQNGKEYMARVDSALQEIDDGLYEKVIVSRRIDLPYRVDLVRTLLRGRQGFSPKRSYSFQQNGIGATGFSPELVISAEGSKIITEPLAGTRSNEGTPEQRQKLREDLLRDPKEIVEHIISVQEAVGELNQFCLPSTVVVEDLMSVRDRGKVQHLGSSVAGMLSPDETVWRALDVLFPSITASGIPKVDALKAIDRLESDPRDLYSGAILLIDGPSSFEATLVLRSVYQDAERQWLQAGAGVINASNSTRELEETREKLSSIANFVEPISK